MKKLITYTLSILSGASYSLMSVSASIQTDESLANAPGVNLTIQGVMGIVQGLACYSTQLVTIIMVVMIIWYGFQMMASQGNETKFATARKSLGYAVIGMIVILGAYSIIATVGNTINGIGAQDLSVRTFTDYVPFQCSF